MIEKHPASAENNVVDLNQKRFEKIPDASNGGVEPEEIAAALRTIGEEDSAHRDLGGGNPQERRLAQKRDELKDGLKALETVPFGEQGRLGSLTLILKDIWALAGSARPNVGAYVQEEINGTTAVQQPENLIVTPKKDIAGTAGLGINQLINAFDRLRTSPLTGRRDEWNVAEFARTNHSKVWGDKVAAAGLLASIDSAYEIIKIFTGRETAMAVAGDEHARRETDREDMRAAKKWLEDLKAIYMEKAGVMKDSRRSPSNSTRSRYGNVVRRAIREASQAHKKYRATP